jgi:hypothetical protein
MKFSGPGVLLVDGLVDCYGLVLDASNAASAYNCDTTDRLTITGSINSTQLNLPNLKVITGSLDIYVSRAKER